jgi:hypothetical protein
MKREPIKYGRPILSSGKPERSAEHCLFAESSTAKLNESSPVVREPESTYALTKIRTLGEGVGSDRLTAQIQKVIASIQSVDSDGYLFVGDPTTLCGGVPSDEKRALCLIWIPGTGKQLLESVENWLHIASSRLSQKLDQETDWFDAIRTIAVQSVGQNVLLATAEGTTADPFVCRVGKLFRIPVLRFSIVPKILDRKWLVRQVEDTENAEALRLGKPIRAFFSWLPESRNASTDDSAGKQANVRRGDADRLLSSLATMSIIVSVRKGGNVYTSSKIRLADRGGPATRLLLNKQLTTSKLAEGLLNAGAIGWRLLTGSKASEFADTEALGGFSEQRSIHFSEVKDQSLLIHWTRRRVGPWPDVAYDEYLDDLIFRSGRRRHNELSALCRILASRTLLASNDLTRDRRPVTCFSAMSLGDLVEKRVFRAHLSRWDFEPYGIAFSPSVLKRQFNARSVVYGDEATWDSLSTNDQPFFQTRQTKTGKIDWRDEKEWRVLGDVDLSQVGPNDAIVFVGRGSDVAAIAELSIWPVVVLPQAEAELG